MTTAHRLPAGARVLTPTEWNDLLEEHEEALASLRAALAAMTARAEKAERERDEIVRGVVPFLPRPNEPQEVRWKGAPDTAQAAVTWAVECAAHSLRREMEHSPPEKRNRLTVFVFFGDEKWNLTLARGDFDHAVEKQRDDARSNAEHFRNLTDTLRARLDALSPVIAAAREVDRAGTVAEDWDACGCRDEGRCEGCTKLALRAALAGLDAGKEKP